MKRLTVKCNEYYCSPDDAKSIKPIYDKLGQLEDIEEELGIDLVTFMRIFKACEKHNYILTKRAVYQIYQIHTYYLPRIEILNDFGENKSFYFSDYGKTWALTREELGNGIHKQ